MLRVGIAVAGDLLRDSVRSCLPENLVVEPYAVRSVREVTHLIQNSRFTRSSWTISLTRTPGMVI